MCVCELPGAFYKDTNPTGSEPYFTIMISSSPNAITLKVRGTNIQSIALAKKHVGV